MTGNSCTALSDRTLFVLPYIFICVWHLTTCCCLVRFRMPDAKSVFYEGESTNIKKQQQQHFSFVIRFKFKLLHDCSDQHEAEKHLIITSLTSQQRVFDGYPSYMWPQIKRGLLLSECLCIYKCTMDLHYTKSICHPFTQSLAF